MPELQEQILEYAYYLDEMRRRIYGLAVVFLITFIIGFFGAGKIIQFCIQTFNIPNVTISTSSPFQYVDLATNIGIFCAIIITAPLVIYQLYNFLKPAITISEQRLFFYLIPFMILLFGVGFGYGAFTLYIAFKALAVLNTSLGISNLWNISQFIAELVVTSTLLGILFEFPIILTFLIKIRMLKVESLITKRRHAYVAMFVFVALLPPTDGISLIMTALPLLGIYEATIFVNRAYRNPELIINS